MVNDTLSDVLTRIRNGCLNHSQTVSIPLTRLSQQICHTLEKEGFIESFQRDTSFLPPATQTSQTFVENAGSMQSEGSRWEKGPNTSDERSSKPTDTNQRFVRNKSNVLIVQLKYSFARKFVGEDLVGLRPKAVGDKKRSCITNLKRISKPGLRVYARHKQIPTVLGGLGILILSTPKGVMTDREARFRKVGGEILCSVW